uniref:Vacuolar protein-sorting-associated protein 36 n=1 Tax=Graphocephala atropunctata TaxID=36148 RepID=A0A1B6K9T8_9HEMI
MDRFEYGDSKLSSGEVETSKERGVKLYDGDHKTSFERGEVVVTSHRLLWGQAGDIAQGLTCLSLPLKLIVFVEEESSSGFGFSRSKKVVLHLTEAPKDRNLGPVVKSLYDYIKLSFKEGLREDFVNILQQNIQKRRWEQIPVQPPSQASALRTIKPRTGIVGIERSIQEKHKATDQSISAAFQDLSKLMTMAKDMVHLSKNISDKIREKQGEITEDETVRFKSYLLSLGIDDPVTRDSCRNESQFHKSLARQLAEFLKQPIEEMGGMMALADVYCRVNRARGLELLSPEDLLTAAQMMQNLDLPVRLHRFDSGVMVLQLTSHNSAAIVSATEQSLKDSGSLSAEQLAQELGISVILAKERLLTTETAGKACRDDTIEGLRFYPNLFLERV